jgi:hypothetical protein
MREPPSPIFFNNLSYHCNLFLYFIISHKKFITFFIVKIDPFNPAIQLWYIVFI